MKKPKIAKCSVCSEETYLSTVTIHLQKTFRVKLENMCAKCSEKLGEPFFTILGNTIEKGIKK